MPNAIPHACPSPAAIRAEAMILTMRSTCPLRSEHYVGALSQLLKYTGASNLSALAGAQLRQLDKGYIAQG